MVSYITYYLHLINNYLYSHNLDQEQANAQMLEVKIIPTLMKPCLVERRQQPQTLVLMLSAWMNLEPLERRQNPIINKMQ